MWKKFNDGWFTYYVNTETGERKFTLEDDDMKDPYMELYESISKAITKLSNMIAWLAKHTLTVSEYTEFADKFTEKKDEQHE